ncbi:DinB family protein [Peribacillus sp. B-H-3]|uniref:DinB family protein n=1 Tax=Peribacillus sp. B-H-3 TaxID=3400420 RepID=UPI003B01192C
MTEKNKSQPKYIYDCHSVLNQLRIAVHSAKEMLKQTPENTMDWKPAEGKRSIREMFVHLSLLCEADLLISQEAALEHMQEYYKQHQLFYKDEILASFDRTFECLSIKISAYNEDDWKRETTSYWDVCYPGYEWLLEILGHFYHHRGQLHAFLTIKGCHINVSLFQ